MEWFQSVSRETLSRFETYLELLGKWNRRINLVGPATRDDAWRRHILDSAQLFPLLAGGTRTVVDLGSGAGLPGLILAILGVPSVHLVESDRRKAAFLIEAARVTGAAVEIHACRIEEAPGIAADAVTARALAPLPDLLGYAERFLAGAGSCYFHKGARWAAELADARAGWRFKSTPHPSLTDPAAVILQLDEITRERAD